MKIEFVFFAKTMMPGPGCILIQQHSFGQFEKQIHSKLLSTQGFTIPKNSVAALWGVLPIRVQQDDWKAWSGRDWYGQI
jgi:hypothetical protein